ncbi:hypothetical protein GIX45_08210 [Erwinia sp. CPCC 100877]|uniref:hypothetical protein n=1 Tax=Enterococcus sp. AZ136 TaxID=2774788 RepID=UPI0012B8BC3C|nr:hypothetical protein [Erwinia sp. CPCC 100877]
MLSMIEVTDQLGLDFYFVELFVVDSMLLIKPLKGMIKTLDVEIPLRKMIVLEHSGIKYGGRFTFKFENKVFTIVDYGNGILRFLEKHLPTFLPQKGNSI